jgi:tetratricopeptide (TPR) repeat protein
MEDTLSYTRCFLLFLLAFLHDGSGPAAADIAKDCYRATLERPGSDDKIIDLCTEAIRVTSGKRWAGNLVSRGTGYLGKRLLDAAMADFDEAIKLDPSVVWAYSNRANIWRMKRQYDLALSEVEEIPRRDLSFIGAYVDRGLVHRDRGDIRSARADFQAVLGMRSNNRDIEDWAKKEA